MLINIQYGSIKEPHPNPPLAKGRGSDSISPQCIGGIKGDLFREVSENRTLLNQYQLVNSC